VVLVRAAVRSLVKRQPFWGSPSSVVRRELLDQRLVALAHWWPAYAATLEVSVADGKPAARRARVSVDTPV